MQLQMPQVQGSSPITEDDPEDFNEEAEIGD